MNNFDLLRLIFAIVVCIVHAEQLSGFTELTVLTDWLSSSVAVKAFFVVSGYLIFMSYDRSASVWNYTKKRIRRIYPAYFTVVVLCAVGLGFVSGIEVDRYFSDEWLKYLAVNLVFLNFLKPDLPGVFDTNRIHAVNGALWTLKIEVMFYISVPFFVLVFKRFGTKKSLVLVYFVSIVYAWLCSQLGSMPERAIYQELGRQLPGQLAYFMAGAFYYYFGSVVQPSVSLSCFWPSLFIKCVLR